MAKTNDIGSLLFTQRLYWTADNPPLISLQPSTEIEFPYRKGWGLVVRAPWSRRAWVLGAWTGRMSEQEALITATGGRVLKDNGIQINEWE